MIFAQLDESVLSTATTATLSRNQSKIDAVVDRVAKVAFAKRKWDKRPRIAFQDVKAQLLCVSAGKFRCSYCEHDRAVELEHVFNKKLFPERTFRFSNLILTCGHCNRLKLDAFAIFDDESGSAITYFPKSGPIAIPATEFNVFINPRAEDPMEFLGLNLKTGFLEIRHAEGTRNFLKARYTLELLELNTHRSLVDARAEAVDDYLGYVNKYVGCRESRTLEAISAFLPHHLHAEETKYSFATYQQRAMAYWATKLTVSAFPHHLA